MLRNVLRCLRCHLIALKTSFVGRHTYKGIINLLKIDSPQIQRKNHKIVKTIPKFVLESFKTIFQVQKSIEHIQIDLKLTGFDKKSLPYR